MRPSTVILLAAALASASACELVPARRSTDTPEWRAYRARWEAEKAAQEAKEAQEAAEKRAASEAAVKRAAQIAELRENPKVLRASWSALACFWEDWRAVPKAQADKELRYGAEFGVVSTYQLYRARDLAELADRQAAAAREELKALEVKALPCKDEGVTLLVSCIEQGESYCGREPPFLDLLYILDPELNRAR